MEFAPLPEAVDHMPYRFKKPRSIARQVRRMAREQLDRAIAELRDASLDRHEAVHQVRKRFKKIRGLIRLVRPGLKQYREVNAWYRDAGRELSRIRDAESMIETVGKLAGDPRSVDHGELLAPLQQSLITRRQAIADEWNDLAAQLDGLAVRLGEQRRHIRDWDIDGNGRDVLFEGLARTYRRARSALSGLSIDSPDEQWHDWRKDCKYHWYHLRLLRDLWPQMLRTQAAEADRLTEFLGDDHDLVLLTALLKDEPETVGETGLPAVRELISRQRERLHQEAMRLGARTFAEKPKAFTRRLGNYWSVWKRND
jgi:CHAD domain-containing protein